MTLADAANYVTLFVSLGFGAMAVNGLLDALKEHGGAKAFGFAYFAAIGSLAAVFFRAWFTG